MQQRNPQEKGQAIITSSFINTTAATYVFLCLKYNRNYQKQ